MWRVFICFSHLLFMNDWFIDYFCWLNPFFFSSLHQIKLIFHLVCNFVFFISVRSLPVWWRHTLLPPIITSLIDRQSADYFLNFGRKLNVCFLLNLKMKKKTSWHQKTINSEIRTVSKSFHWSITALINEPITSALICFHSPTSTHNQYSDTLWLLISFVLLLFTFKMN